MRRRHPPLRSKGSRATHRREHHGWSSIFGWISRHPIATALVCAVVYIVAPNAKVQTTASAGILKVNNGFEYALAQNVSTEIVPLMVQQSFLGFPREAGVVASVYYLTKEELLTARQQYAESGGCWPSTVSSFQKQLLLVGSQGDLSPIKRRAELPMPDGPIQSVSVRGHNLVLRSDSEEADVAQQFADMRTGEFFALMPR